MIIKKKYLKNLKKFYKKYLKKKIFKFFFYSLKYFSYIVYTHMGGGLMQLVAYGAQDVYLTGDPEITFFKVVYRRHTNFSAESIQQTINGTVALGGDVTVTISRNGDLVNNLLVEAATCTAGVGASLTRLGFALLKETEIEIGGQRIDKQYSSTDECMD